MPPRTRKKKKKPADDAPALCAFPSCTEPCWENRKYCPTHALVAGAIDRAEKAAKKGNVWDTVLGYVGVAAAQAGAPHIQQIAARVTHEASDFMQRQQGPQGQAGPAPRSPRRGGMSPAEAFQILGLDPARATVKDVKKMQVTLAKIYHPDKAASGVASAMQVRINAAAQTCIEALKA